MSINLSIDELFADAETRHKLCRVYRDVLLESGVRSPATSGFAEIEPTAELIEAEARRDMSYVLIIALFFCAGSRKLFVGTLNQLFHYPYREEHGLAALDVTLGNRRVVSVENGNIFLVDHGYKKLLQARICAASLALLKHFRQFMED